MEAIATPNFGFPVQWLAVGALQLHLFERPDGPPRYHHVAFTVAEDAFPALYRKVRAAAITIATSGKSTIFRHSRPPAGIASLDAIWPSPFAHC